MQFKERHTILNLYLVLKTKLLKYSMWLVCMRMSIWLCWFSLGLFICITFPSGRLGHFIELTIFFNWSQLNDVDTSYFAISQFYTRSNLFQCDCHTQNSMSRLFNQYLFWLPRVHSKYIFSPLVFFFIFSSYFGVLHVNKIE